MGVTLAVTSVQYNASLCMNTYLQCVPISVFPQSYELYNLFSRTLQKAKVPLVDIQVCAKDPTYVGKGLNTSLLLCAGEKGNVFYDLKCPILTDRLATSKKIRRPNCT
jgi:hypothetical protein